VGGKCQLSTVEIFPSTSPEAVARQRSAMADVIVTSQFAQSE
jgi:hypothetical protein